jgi:hypothetical protein
MRRKSLNVTLEDFLGPEITNRIGPFVALGNPLDFVPPDGAARAYVADDEWPKHFADLVRRARCMVPARNMSCGSSRKSGRSASSRSCSC